MSCLSLSWNDLSLTLCSSKLWVMNYFQTRGLFKEEKILQQAGAARILLPKRGSFHTVTVGSDGWALASVSTMATNSHFHSNGSSSSRSSSSTTATVVGTSLLTTTSVLNTHFYRSLFQHSLLLLSKDKAETQALKKKTSSTSQRAEKLLFFVHVFVAFVATSTTTLLLFWLVSFAVLLVWRWWRTFGKAEGLDLK